MTALGLLDVEPSAWNVDNGYPIFAFDSRRIDEYSECLRSVGFYVRVFAPKKKQGNHSASVAGTGRRYCRRAIAEGESGRGFSIGVGGYVGLTVPAGAISKADAAELLGCSERTVERNRSDFDVACTRPGLHGCLEPLIAVSSLPPAAQEQLDERARKLTPAPGQMALGITMPTGRNLSEEDQAETERRFKAIEPLVDPAKFHALRAQCHNRKCELANHQAGQYGVKRSTIYEWKRLFEKGGVSALAPKDRADKGVPRVFNDAALDFLLAACLPKGGCQRSSENVVF